VLGGVENPKKAVKPFLEDLLRMRCSAKVGNRCDEAQRGRAINLRAAVAPLSE
jgi:hypothetical protein